MAAAGRYTVRTLAVKRHRSWHIGKRSDADDYDDDDGGTTRRAEKKKKNYNYRTAFRGKINE